MTNGPGGFTHRQLATLGAAMLGFFVVGLDAQIVNVALPDIGKALGGGLSALQWIITGYTLTFSALILFAGTLSDRIGARHTYMLGMVLFVVASTACGLAPNLGVLVAARLVQGAGAALVTPTSLALIREGFTKEAQRTRAIGLWAVGGSVAAAAGPIVGGALTIIDWRFIFWVNIPVVAFALLCATRTVVSPRRKVPFDVVGQLCAIVALGSFTFAVIEGEKLRWTSPIIIGLFIVTVFAGAGFLAAQHWGAHPMVPLRLFTDKQLCIVLVVAFTTMAAFYGVVFVQSLYFQNQRHESALMTGVLFLPMTALVTILSAKAATLIDRFGRRALITCGVTLQAAGLLVIAFLPESVSIWTVSAAMILVGGGGALTVPPLTSIVLDHAPIELAGTASGVLNTFRQVGGSLGVAGIGAVIAAHTAFMSGMRIGLVATVIVLLVTAVLSLGLDGRKRSHA
ncbi:MFS transporter [Nocardia camponoti]|uniref:MFS transporter n=1 Tax=Nocardia camponoti TaxID=1616106 RepID=A0A917Q9M1_9NOCA|nr:MFS transporter [Nocardia camponoti]GGK36562.1 MFS transporter [Nocardia camponoti]